MVTADRRDDLNMLNISRRLLPPIIDRSIEEAEQLDSVGVEVALMRTWLYQTLRDEKHLEKDEFTRRLFNDVVRAVTVKYRLSPKDADAIKRSIRETAEELRQDRALFLRHTEDAR
jgi:hypothetical protein